MITTKLLTLVKYLSPFHWQQDIAYFKSKKLLIYLIVGGLIYAGAYLHGLNSRPVHVDLGGQEAHITISDNEQLHIFKDGKIELEDASGRKLHTITVKDIPELQKALMPFGLEFKPFVTVGGSIGVTRQIQPEAGAGADLFKIYKANLAAWATQYGVYIGADYYITNNSGVIVGVGHGWKSADVRTYLGWKWNF